MYRSPTSDLIERNEKAANWIDCSRKIVEEQWKRGPGGIIYRNPTSV